MGEGGADGPGGLGAQAPPQPFATGKREKSAGRR